MSAWKHREEPRIGARYRHFKGGLYEVMAVALDAEDAARVVVYRDITTGQVWTRRLVDWNRRVRVHNEFCDRFSLTRSSSE